MSKFLQDDDNNDTKAIAILQVFPENNQAKIACISQQCFQNTFLVLE